MSKIHFALLFRRYQFAPIIMFQWNTFPLPPLLCSNHFTLLNRQYQTVPSPQTLLLQNFHCCNHYQLTLLRPMVQSTLDACERWMEDFSSRLSHGCRHHSSGSNVWPSSLLMLSSHPSSQLLSWEPTSFSYSSLVVLLLWLPTSQGWSVGCDLVCLTPWCCLW